MQKIKIRALPIIMLIGLAIANTLCVLPMFSFYYPTVDLGETVYHARQLVNGEVPYRDFFTHHFMGYIVPFALIERGFGLTQITIWISCIGCQVINSLLAYIILKPLTNKPVAALGAFLTATIGWFWGWYGMTFNNQSYLLPLLYLFLALVIQSICFKRVSSAVLANLCFGTLFTFDQRIVFFVPLVAVSYFSLPLISKPKFIIANLLSLSLVPSLSIAYFYFNGALQSWWDQTITFPLFARNCLNPFRNEMILSLLKYGVISERGPVLFAILGLALALIRRKEQWLSVLLIFGYCGSMAYAISGGRDYPNYLLPFAPFIIICIGLLLYEVSKISSRIYLLALATVMTLALKNLLYPFYYFYQSNQWLFPVDDRAIQQAAKIVKANSHSCDKILVWGYAPAIYNLSDRFSIFQDVGLSSITGNNFFTSESSEQCINNSMLDEFKSTLLSEPPKFIVVYNPTGIECTGGLTKCLPSNTDVSRTFPLLNFDYTKAKHLAFFDAFIHENYHIFEATTYPQDNFVLYHLN